LKGDPVLTVIAKIKVKPDQAAAFEAEAKKMVTHVQANEPGTKTYICHRSTADPAVYLFYEVYEDQVAFAAHGGSSRHAGVLRGHARHRRRPSGARDVRGGRGQGVVRLKTTSLSRVSTRRLRRSVARARRLSRPAKAGAPPLPRTNEDRPMGIAVPINGQTWVDVRVAARRKPVGGVTFAIAGVHQVERRLCRPRQTPRAGH
jgi:quinol monooxygenase YgiN